MTSSLSTVVPSAAATSTAQTKQFATFVVSELSFGVEVLRVQEVLRYQPMTAVPLMPSVVRGLLNLRGQIVPAIDLRERLTIAPRPDECLPMNVVVRTEEGAVSLLVDEIGDVLEVDARQFEDAPDTMSGATRELVNGVYKLDDRLLLVLDVERAAAVSGAAGPGGA